MASDDQFRMHAERAAPVDEDSAVYLELSTGQAHIALDLTADETADLVNSLVAALSETTFSPEQLGEPTRKPEASHE